MIAIKSQGSIGSERSHSHPGHDAQSWSPTASDPARDVWESAAVAGRQSRSVSPRRGSLSRALTSASSTPSEAAGLWSRTLSGSASPRAGDGGLIERGLPLSPNRAVARLTGEPGAAPPLAARGEGQASEVDGEVRGGVERLVAAAFRGDLPRFCLLCAYHGEHIGELARAHDAWLVRAATRAGPSYARALLTHLEAFEWHPLLTQDGCRGFRNILDHRDAELVRSLCAATADGPMRALLEGASAEVRAALFGRELKDVLRAVMARLGISLPPSPPRLPYGGWLPDVGG